jgi:peptidoglycan/xylan/chitin deacetylase (PgdA/CDA1 family)
VLSFRLNDQQLSTQITAMTITMATAGKRIGGRLAVLLSNRLPNRSGDSFGILLYHRSTRVPEGIEAPTMNVTPTQLRAQLEGVLRLGYTFWSLREVLRRVMEGYSLPSNIAVLTFDDGYENFHLNVWPLLLERRIPATLFVTTAYIGSSRPFPFDKWGCKHREQTPPEAWRPLTWTQCLEMEQSGVVEIGSHSHTHQNFRGRPDELRRDLTTSLSLLEAELGPSSSPRAFSFPYGSARSARGAFADASLTDVARSCGVSCSLTTEIALANPATSPYGWGRLEVVDSDSSATLRAKLQGWYSWMGTARQAYRRLLPS